MTARRAQAVKSAAGEVVAVEHAQRAVELVGPLATATDEARGTDAEPIRSPQMAVTLIAAPLPG